MKALMAGLFFAIIVLPGAAFARTNIISNAEQQVRAFFAGDPVMAAIAQCESKFTQFNPSGSVLHGGTGHRMIGIFQINAIHRKVAKALGWDINTIEGNLAYAEHLFEQEGTTPWLSSASCWEPVVQSAGATAVSVVNKSVLIARLQFQIAELSQKVALLKAAATSTLSDRTF